MGDADVVYLVAPDFQLAYGSPAVFQSAKFVRIADTPAEMRDNAAAPSRSWRPAETSRAGRTCWQPCVGSGSAVAAKIAAGTRSGRKLKKPWHRLRRVPRKASIQSRSGLPFRKRSDDAVVITDGGDFLSFARVGLNARRCSIPALTAASASGCPMELRRASLFLKAGCRRNGMALGFNAIEVDTAVRHKVQPDRRRQQRRLADRGARPDRHPR